MKNILIHNGAEQELLSNVDDGSNTIFINGVEIPSSSWIGSGDYTHVISGTTIYIKKISAMANNIMLQRISDNHYQIVAIGSSGVGKYLVWKNSGPIIWG